MNTGTAASRSILALSLLLVGAQASRAEGDAEKGRELAQQVCRRCHVIGASNIHGSIGSTPSFFLMSEKLDAYRPRILSLIDRRPHIAQDLGLEPADLKDLLAYIETLERPSARSSSSGS